MKMNILILESDRIWNTALNSVFVVNSAAPKEHVSYPSANPATGSMRTQAMAGGVSYAIKPLGAYEGFWCFPKEYRYL